MYSGVSQPGRKRRLPRSVPHWHDFAVTTRKAIISDIKKFALWFTTSNHEPFVVGRVTTRDVTDFREYLRRERGQAVASVNRAIVLLRKFFDWLTEEGHIPLNPAKGVKELRRQALAPEGTRPEPGPQAAP